MFHTLLNPVTAGTVGSVRAALQVLETVMSARDGKTTKFSESLHPPDGVVYVAIKQPAVLGVKTPVDASTVPPPFIDQVPPESPPDCVNVTVPPPIQAFPVVTTGLVQVTHKAGLASMIMLATLVQPFEAVY